MFTLVYINNQFNRPDALLPFLQTNVGKSEIIQIDCVTPFYGTEKELIQNVCKYLDDVDQQIEVTYNRTLNVTTEKNNGYTVHYLVIQINISDR